MEFLKLILEHPVATILIIIFASLGISEIVSSFHPKRCKCKKKNSDDTIIKS